MARPKPRMKCPFCQRKYHPRHLRQHVLRQHGLHKFLKLIEMGDPNLFKDLRSRWMTWYEFYQRFRKALGYSDHSDCKALAKRILARLGAKEKRLGYHVIMYRVEGNGL